MSEPSVDTQEMHRLLKGMKEGDLAARERLIRGVCAQLERLARKMLRRFPNVQAWAETSDVLQNALMRLLRSLQQMEPPASMPQFYALAAQQMRRELLDLARRHCASHRPGMVHASQLPGGENGGFNPVAPADDPGELEYWCAFHEEVEKLPPEEREVVGLIFYHGWAQAAVGEMLQVTERTVRRRWASALVRLNQALGGRAP
jgi:RNA polymerase sigma-70 factor (ECF subfamily)